MENVRLFVNNNDESRYVASKVVEKLQEAGLSIVENNYDLAIAIGGDGAFLRMVKNANFNEECLYIGINTGTLGFAQEVNVDEIDSFISALQTNDYKVEQIGVEEIVISTKDSSSRHVALNEVVVRDSNLNTANLDIEVDGQLLERFVGDGLLVSTSFGSTAYNLSYGGSIVYNTFHTLQVTPIAPLNNRSYRNLLNSVILPSDKEITIRPTGRTKDLMLSIDGDNIIYPKVEKLSVFQQREISVFRMKEYNFVKKINDKFVR